MFDWKKFLEDVAKVSDFVTALKLLGFILFVGKYGPEPLMTGDLFSLRTYYRYCELIKSAGWGSLLAEMRAVQAVKELADELGLDHDGLTIKLSTLLEGPDL